MKRAICLFLIFIANGVIADDDVTMPNDPLFNKQWGLHNAESGYDIGALSAWQIERGDKNIAVVVMGTGVNYLHPDLVNNMWKNPREIAANGIDDDNNGYIDDIHGVNAINGTGDPMDDHGHETFVAGIIGAEVNNGIGIAGIMHHVSIIACKFLDKNGAGTTEAAIKCLEYVEDLAKNGDVKIVATNNAWGGGEYDEALERAIKRQRDLGILFVTGAGSQAKNLDHEPVYPASYDVSNIIVVGKMSPNGRHVMSSSTGPNTVHLSAPGAKLMSTWLKDGYKELSGSFSTAYASGILGLIQSQNPFFSYSQLKHILVASAKKLPEEVDQAGYISGGYAHAQAALEYWRF